jgi:putative intracellular protease/amidase
MRLLEDSKPIEACDVSTYDAIYLTGGHGVMWGFPDDAPLQAAVRVIFEKGGIVAAVCHGYCGLLNVRLSDGRLLVNGRKLTGFSWVEEIAAGVSGIVPYNAEQIAKERGARYEKALIPFRSYAVADGTLITGQNPFSARLTARMVVDRLRDSIEGRSTTGSPRP